MTKTEGGEFELVLGNRQLLSAFFIVVVLFGVFFAMGYIVGRNSSPTLAKSAATSDTTSAESKPAASVPPPPVVAPAEPPRQTQAAQSENPAASSAIQEKPAPPKDEKSAHAAPAAGQYLQVAATKGPEAEVLSDTLRNKGFSTVITNAPSGLFRVLVGPFSDTASLGKAKSDLIAAGFKAPFVQKIE